MATLDALGPAEAAARFIARRAEGLTAQEQQLLAAWLARDEAHRREFANADRAWQVFADVRDDEILAAMRAHALAPRPRPAVRPWHLAVAASLLLLIGATFFLRPGPPAAGTQYVSARGEVTEHALPDGSRMTLDADSAAIGTFSARQRQVVLERGRALFSVQPDTTRPFMVVAAGHRIVAVGTRFDVNLAAETLTVTLLEGKVEVSTGDPARAAITLSPGQQFRARDGQPSIKTLEAPGADFPWRTGLINFDNQSLAEAVSVMNRYSREQILIQDASLRSVRLSGQFRAGDTVRFAETLAEMHGLRVVRRGDLIELAPQ